MQYNQNHEFVAHRNIRNPDAPTAATAAAFMPLLMDTCFLLPEARFGAMNYMCVYVFFVLGREYGGGLLPKVKVCVRPSPFMVD